MIFDKQKSIFEQEVDPKWQAIIIICAIPLLTLLFWLPSKLGAYDIEDYFSWTVAAALTLLYTIFNSVFSLSSNNQIQYWGRSITGYLSVVFIGGLFAYLFSGIGINDAMSFKWIYIVFTFVYLVFLSIVSAMRKIVKIAQRQDKRMRGEE